MLRKLSLAVLALCFCTAPFSTDSIALPLRMPGTEWAGAETRSENTPLRFVFTTENVLMINGDGATVGLWEQDHDRITMRFIDGRVVYTGTVRGQLCVHESSITQNADNFYVFRVGVRCRPAMMSGTARNGVGAAWNWSTTTNMLPLQVSGAYDGTPFVFPIPLGSDGVGVGETIIGRDNPWPGRLTWDLRLVQP